MSDRNGSGPGFGVMPDNGRRWREIICAINDSLPTHCRRKERRRRPVSALADLPPPGSRAGRLLHLEYPPLNRRRLEQSGRIDQERPVYRNPGDRFSSEAEISASGHPLRSNSRVLFVRGRSRGCNR